MKRLTERYEENGVQIKDAGQYPPLVGETLVCHRLADIEDILCDGTDEYDLDRLRVIISQCMTMRDEVSHRFSLTAKIPLDRLREIAEAEREGRCVVVPRKFGEPVYFALLGRVIEKSVFSVVSFSHSQRIYCNGTSEYFRPEDVGKTVFLTREEAEAALRREQDA